MAQIAIRAGMEVIRVVPWAYIDDDLTKWWCLTSLTVFPAVPDPSGAPLKHDARMIEFSNLTDADLYISDINLDGYEKMVIAARSSKILDLTSNRTDQGQSLSMAKGTVFYVKPIDGEDPSSGDIWMSVFYGSI